MGGLSILTNSGDSYNCSGLIVTRDLDIQFFALPVLIDSKQILELLTDEPTLPICAEVLQLDLSPLQKVVFDSWLPDRVGQSWDDLKSHAGKSHRLS